MEVPRPKPKGLQAPRVFARGTLFTKASSHIFILLSSRTSKEGFLLPMVSLGTPLETVEGIKPSPLVELNPNMLVGDVERMYNVV